MHIANLTAQTTATLDKQATQTSASLQQLVANTAQLHQQQQAIMNQMAMISLGGAYQGATAVVTPQQTAHAPPQIYLPPALPHHQQGYNTTSPHFGGRGRTLGGSGGRSHGGRGHGCGQGSPQVLIPAYVRGAQLVPYVQGVAQQGQCAPCKNCTNKTKWYANQNVCYTCGLDVKDWHTSGTCQCKKKGHQDDFTCANHMQFAQAGYPFCKIAMHKNLYPSTRRWGAVKIDIKSSNLYQQTSLYPTLINHLLPLDFRCTTINQRRQCYSHGIKSLHTIAMLGMHKCYNNCCNACHCGHGSDLDLHNERNTH